jgi:SAM-dependent methyltransferase
MATAENNRQIIEETGNNYDAIIFEEDFIPKNVYLFQIDLRNKIIENSFAGKRFPYLLDLGCGTGFHLQTLSRYADTIIGIDMSFGALKHCKKKISGDYIVCDIRYLPFKPETIDCIWTAGVLHHVPDDLECVIGENIAKILKPDGVFLVDEPNNLNPLNYLILKMSKADPTGKERPLSVSRVGGILRSNGFSIIRSTNYEFFSPFGVGLGSKSLMRFFNILDSWLSHGILRSFLLRWTVYARKE